MEERTAECRRVDSLAQRRRLRRVSLSLFINFINQTKYIPSTFDIHYSLFDIRFWIYFVCQSFFIDQTGSFTASSPAR